MVNWSDFNTVGNERDYLLKAFDSGWVSGGDYVSELENMLQAVFPGSEAISASNGTIALQLAFQLMELKPGDEVIVPSFCFQAAANVLIQLGAKPVFCDIDVLTWSQNVRTLSEARTNRTVGLVIVHNYGCMADMEKIVDWADQNGVWIIEDCAEAWFSMCRGKYAGQFGALGTYSMHATKTISCGEGGVTLINDQKLVGRARLLRSHGLARSGTHYFPEVAGNNYRLSNLHCALACAQLEQREYIIEQKKKINRIMEAALLQHPLIETQLSCYNCVDVKWAVAIRLNFDLLAIERDGLMRVLKESGIETRPGFYNASQLEIYGPNPVVNSKVSGAISEEVIVLPCATSMTQLEIDQVCNEVVRLVDDYFLHGEKVEFVTLTNEADSRTILEGFLSRIELGRAKFRYFENRTFEALRSHLFTSALCVDDTPVCYGHLDSDDGKTWLGIAVADEFVGSGFGKTMIRHLLKQARSMKQTMVHLMVDSDNYPAIKLYEKNGFRKISFDREKDSLLMVHELY